jgi:hypothetical protein
MRNRDWRAAFCPEACMRPVLLVFSLPMSADRDKQNYLVLTENPQIPEVEQFYRRQIL